MLEGGHQNIFYNYTNGNAWLVNTIKIVENANEEILALDSLKTKTEAVIDKRFVSEGFKINYPKDSTATIQLTSYALNNLVYDFNATENQFDGYIATGGTEANIQALWVYRNFFINTYNAKLSEIMIIASEDTHYSIAKGANLLSIEWMKVPVDFEIRLDSRRQNLQKRGFAEPELRPAFKRNKRSAADHPAG